MVLEIFVLGSTLGLVIMALFDKKKRTSPTSRVITTEGSTHIPRPTRMSQGPIRHRFDEYPLRRGRETHVRISTGGTPNLLRLLHTRNRNVFTRVVVENWRRSIIGLIKLAEENLESAKVYLKTRNYVGAVQTACTSVENIARALIYCYGDKPEPGTGQEEALRILSRRFKGNERIEFEKAVDNVACINNNRIAQKFLSKHNMPNQLFDEERTKQILEYASAIVSLFKQIINEHFGREIQETHKPRAPTEFDRNTSIRY